MAHAKPPHPAALDPDALLRQCTLQRTRGTGPGGQHRNKTETAVRLTHTPTGVTAQAGERRSQAENRRVALRRLRMNLALQVRGEAPAAPSERWQSRCRNRQITVNPRHADFPALLAEALDVIAAHGYDLARAAKILGVTPSQLIKLLKLEPAAHHHVNTQRQQRHLKPLH
ncbi:MAG: peptide chain release factor family protein [Phycisphaeraceae bacterium]